MALETDATNGGATAASNTMNPEAAMSNQVATPAPTPAPAPTPTPANQPTQPAQEPQPPALIHPQHRSMFGALASALIGGTLGTVAKGVKAAAGPQPADYTTDANGRVIRDPNQRPDTTASRLQRLAEAALMGLAYGAQAGPQKSAAASWAAGLGAGAQGQMQHAQGQDLLKRQQAAENYERTQKQLTDNAIRAMHRASTVSLWQKNMDEQNDHDPERAKNVDVVNAAQDYIQRNPGAGMGVEFVTDAQAKAIHDQEIAALKNDPTHATKLSVMLPVGMTEAKDQDGNPLYEQDGETPKQVGRIAVIKGGDKMPLPQSFVDDVKEYGKSAQIGGADTLKAGQEVPIAQFLMMDARLNGVKKQEIDGWKPSNGAHVLKRPDGTEVLVNGFNGKTREATSTPGGAPSINVQAIQNELNKGATGERASEIAAGLQTQIDDPANAAIKPTLQKLQTQANSQAEASTKFATKKAGAVAGAEAEAKQRYEVNKPVYAYNTQTKQLEQTTKGTVAANPTQYSNPIDVKEADVRKDTDLARQLGDAQLNLSRYRVSAQKLDSLSLADKRAVAALVGEDKFKAEFMGAQIPTDWLNKLLTAENWNMLPTAAQDAVIGYIGSRGAVIAYQKAVSGSGRSNKEQLELELQNIPNPLLPKDVRERQFDRFQQNIDQTGAGLPKMVGVERPKEIRQRIEAESAPQGQIPPGATHIGKDTNGNIVGYVLNGQWVSVGGKQ